MMRKAADRLGIGAVLCVAAALWCAGVWAAEPVAREAPPQEVFEALPRFGASVFADARPPTEAAPAETTPVANTPAPPNYIVGPGDSLALEVWAANRAQVTQTVAVSPEGALIFPQIGRVPASGQTLEQLRQSLVTAYGRLYSQPTVTLVVAAQRIVEVYVTGDAKRPGKYALRGMATVFGALYAAGGPSEIGSFRRIQLHRIGQGPVDVDLYAYLLSGKREGDVLLAPGDTVFIPSLSGEVGIAGEVRRPARYETSGPMTVRQALEMAGGLKPSAYSRLVQLWRSVGGRQWELAALDCSDPDGPAMATELRDGDLLVARPLIPSGYNVVQVIGAVKRPGYYPVETARTVRDALEAAQWVRADAHVGSAVIRRLDERLQPVVVTFSLADALAGKPEANLPLERKDILEVFSQSDVEPSKEVSVIGAVARPGAYPWGAQMRVSGLVLQAGGVTPDAYMGRADILRLTADQTREVLAVNLKAALAGDPESDLTLERGDILKVALRSEAGPAPMAHIAGLVRRPGSYPRPDGMKVSDLIFAAGGLEPGAGPRLELVPGRSEGAPKTTELTLWGDSGSYTVTPDPVLGDDDTVNVTGRGEFEAKAAVVTLAGRVRAPGSYAIKPRSSGERTTVWELLKKGGGLLADANPEGIVIYRKREALAGPAQTDDLNRLLRSVNREAGQPAFQAPVPDGGAEPGQVAALETTVAQGLTSVLSGQGGVSIVLPPRPVSSDDWVSAIPVDGAKLLASEGLQGNIELEPGDTVSVPRSVNTVTILGAVPRSGAVPYVANRPVREYLSEAGGLREDAADERMVVVHANGAVAPIAPTALARPGDVIVVPTKHIVRTVRTESDWQLWLRTIIPLATAALIF